MHVVGGTWGVLHTGWGAEVVQDCSQMAKLTISMSSFISHIVVAAASSWPWLRSAATGRPMCTSIHIPSLC